MREEILRVHPRENLHLHILIQNNSCDSDPKLELPVLLLIVESCRCTGKREGQWYGRFSSSLDGPGGAGAKQHDAVSESEFRAVVLVLLEEVA